MSKLFRSKTGLKDSSAATPRAKTSKKTKALDLDLTAAPTDKAGKKSTKPSLLRRLTQNISPDEDPASKPVRSKKTKRTNGFDLDADDQQVADESAQRADKAEKKKSKGLLRRFTTKNDDELGGAVGKAVKVKSGKATKGFDLAASEQQVVDETAQRAAKKDKKKAGGEKLVKKGRTGDKIGSMSRKEVAKRFPEGVLDGESSSFSVPSTGTTVLMSGIGEFSDEDASDGEAIPPQRNGARRGKSVANNGRDEEESDDGEDEEDVQANEDQEDEDANEDEEEEDVKPGYAITNDQVDDGPGRQRITAAGRRRVPNASRPSRRD